MGIVAGALYTAGVMSKTDFTANWGNCTIVGAPGSYTLTATDPSGGQQWTAGTTLVKANTTTTVATNGSPSTGRSKAP